MFKKIVKDRLNKILNIGLGIDKDELWYDLIYRGFIWDTFCTIRKIGRFIRRLNLWIPKLWVHENWDFDFYTIELLKLDLTELDK
jgi:hypothetical protein